MRQFQSKKSQAYEMTCIDESQAFDDLPELIKMRKESLFTLELSIFYNYK